MLASGFTDAPVCRVLLFSIIISSIVVNITYTRHLFYVTLVPHIWHYNQYWRLLIWQTCYTNATELLFAAVSIYHLRIIERLWGSRKFASFILSVLPTTLLVPPLILALLLRPFSFNRLNTLPTGPTPLVFALLAQYHASIPHVRKYHIIPSSSTHGISDGITLSDKTVNYLLASQLAFSSVPGSMIAAGVGWSIGVAWRHELGPVTWARWRVSGRVVGESTKDDEGVDNQRRKREGEQGRATGLEEVGGGSRNRGKRSGIVT